ncbi:MAG: class I SAM-dependent methyltransferase [Gaiellaceae bacterium]
MKDYVRDYFDRHADAWVEAAYAGGTRFPLGPERVRLALEGVSPAFRDAGALVDLGCGGGQLCVHAARLGWSVVGVDVAAGMIEQAERDRGDLPVRYVLAAFDENGLDEGAFDAVTAMGLIEYLPDDDAFFVEAGRLLRPGGRVAVSCRNRLYNLQSANEYTARELEREEAGALLDELRELLDGSTDSEVHALAGELVAAAPDLAEAARRDAEEPPDELFHHPTRFAEERRQHTPRQLREAAEPHGFREAGVLPLHPHPLPSRLEPVAPRVYNRLALAWQRALETSPLGLAYCSAFVGVFERC